MNNLDKAGIYIITNNINNKRYVGKAKRKIKYRWKDHCKNAIYLNLDTYLYRAIRKYGIDNFTIELLDEEYSNEKEIYWISKLNPEYNMTKGGDGGWINDQTGKRWKVKDTTKMRIANKLSEKKRIEIYSPKISSGNNYQSVYYIYTPWGMFETWRDASNSAKEERKKGNNNVISDTNTLQLYCKNNTLLSENGRRTPKEWRGKYTQDIGFKIVNKEVKDG